jgi:hypothetical protein
MGLLARSKVSGTFAISSSSPGTVVLRIPPTAEDPALVVVKNSDAAAILYGKWVPYDQTNPTVSTLDAGIRLEPYESYTEDKPPGNAALVFISTVNNSRANVNGNWTMPEDAQLL